jgi:hypothetical protein
LILMLAFVVSTPAADWVADGDNWKVTTANYDDVVVTAAVKAQLEQCRASANHRFRWAEDALDASDWVNLLKVGFQDTRHNNALVKHYILDPGSYKWWVPLWRDFVARYASDTNPDPDAQALTITVREPLPQP